MKNLIVNIFKTLFFFDAAVIIIHLLPSAPEGATALERLIAEAEIAAVPLLLTVIYFFTAEKRRLGAPFNRRIFGAAFCGFRCTFFPAAIVTAVLVLTKSLSFGGISLPEKLAVWLAAALCECMGTELLLRGYLFALYKKHYGFTAAAVITVMLYCSLSRDVFTAPKIYATNMLIFNFILCFVADKYESVTANISARFFYTVISRFLLGGTRLFGEYPVILKTEYSGKEWLTGGEAGIENSAVTLGVSAAVLLLLANRKYRFTKRLRERIKARRAD